MTDWNKKTRAECEAWAEAGDAGAAAALRLHQSLDRIEASVQGFKREMEQGFASLGQSIAEAQAATRELPDSAGGSRWLRRVFGLDKA